MMRMNKEEFIRRSKEALGEIYDLIQALPEMKVENLKSDKTALVIVDMINGFAREGALMSPRVEGLISEIKQLSERCGQKGILKLAFADAHTDASPEFDAYPVHCLVGTHESELVDELLEQGEFLLIPKNSTNGFLEEGFQAWLRQNEAIDTYVVVGDCTDICIQQFAITLKTWFNRQNKRVRVIVPENMVDTYDLGTHNGDLMHVMALYSMMGNGVEVVGSLV